MSNRKSIFANLILVLIVVLFATIAGFANKTNSSSLGSTSAPQQSTDKQSTDKTATSASAKPTTVTYENYEKISLGMTYDQVKAFMGEGKKKELKSNKIPAVDYTWKDGSKSILIKIEDGKVVLKHQNKLEKATAKITFDQFKKITIGMTFDQVVGILGSDYSEISCNSSNNSVLREVAWTLADSTHVRVYLKDGKVTKRTSNLKS